MSTTKPADRHFPRVKGQNLNGDRLVLPRDLAGELNLTIIAFQRYQQQLVNTWIGHLETLERRFRPERFRFYELPTIATGYVVMRGFIDGGMRAGIPDPAARERTITLYLKKRGFRAALGIESEDTIYCFLVDQAGAVLWHTTGAYDDRKLDALTQSIRTALGP